jgi:surface antigen
MSAAARGAVLAVMAACAMPAAAIIGSDMPYANFTEKDHEIFRKALDGALEKGADGATLKWSNPETNARGEIKPLKTFERGGAPCRTVSIFNHAKGREASAPWTLCKTADKWNVVPADPPAKKDAAKKP